MPPHATRERILDAAQDLMLEKSFHSVGLNEILKAVRVPKGSFYHHFKSKEQFGVELLRHYSAAANAHKRRVLLSSEPESNPRSRLLTFLESSIGCFLENEGRCPCLIVKLSAEVADFSEPMRLVLVEGQEEWIGITENVLVEGIEKGNIAPLDSTRETAIITNCLWIGAMHEAVIARNVDCLRRALDHVANCLVPPANF